MQWVLKKMAQDVNGGPFHDVDVQSENKSGKQAKQSQ